MKRSELTIFWRPVYDTVRDRIACGKYPHGTLLPSLATLAAEFGTTPATVAKGLQALAAEGLVGLGRPSGYYVGAAPPVGQRHRRTEPLPQGAKKCLECQAVKPLEPAGPTTGELDCTASYPLRRNQEADGCCRAPG